jgi:hypothetical protein
MRPLVEPIYLEVLRVVYAVTLRGRPAVLTVLGVLALVVAAAVMVVAWRLLTACRSDTPPVAAAPRRTVARPYSYPASSRNARPTRRRLVSST